ncbi:MAG: hypothetical protein R3261_08770, partial [Alphaproteobacteria bacterium]|nr:hypothetical protein [Alphaproteobacteria bacterium]
VQTSSRIDLAWHLFNIMDKAHQQAGKLNMNLFIAYGAREDVVPDYGIESFLNNLPPHNQDRNSKILLKTYNNGYHMITRDLEGDKVSNDIAEFVLRSSQSAN